jgi:hypothetical protein
MKYLRLVLALTFFSVRIKAQLTGDSWKSAKANGSADIMLTYNYSGKFIYKNMGQIR